jgi:hypothetical protein
LYVYVIVSNFVPAMKISGWNCFQKNNYKYVIKHIALLITLCYLPYFNAPAQDYFQQEVNYKIQVTLNDLKNELHAFESIEYINNSPDTLGFLYFHLWPNAYSNNSTGLAREILYRDGQEKLFTHPELKGYIDSLNFIIEGSAVVWNLQETDPDICKIILNTPLLPGDTISITTPFHVVIPKGVTSRLGHIGESYQISQWYPKPAVYDRNGWHQMPYLDQGEFYSEYGSFDVSITLPENYIVGATGNLQNKVEVEMLNRLSEDRSWIKTISSGDEGFPVSSKEMKTLRYTENNIHDFAWFADKRFHVLKGKVRLPESGREVDTWAMFTNQEAPLWTRSIEYINNALLYFSKWNGDYPYNSFTAIQSALTSGAGMEYPGLTVIGLAKDPYLLDEVIAHEICHSWFYSAIGSNERRYPYMDESLASAYETRYMEARYPGKKLWELEFANRKLARFFNILNMPVARIQELQWLIPARNNLEQPVNLPAVDYSYDNYGSIVYYKAGIGFNYLRSYLGDPLFDSIMHDYYKKWQNKHPLPEDLRKVFELRTNKDLSWFFDDFLGTTKRVDYKLVRFDNNKLLIRNKGEIKAPLLIAGMKGDSIVLEKWVDGFAGKEWVAMESGNYSTIEIDPQHKMTEIFRLNNNIRTSGIFPKSDPLHLQFGYTIDDPDKRTLIYLPAFDWNKADGFMIGLAMHNGTMLSKPIEYFIMPFYSFKNNSITGYGKASINIIPYNRFIRLATFSIETSNFGAIEDIKYHTVKLGSDLFLRSKNLAVPVVRKVFGYYIAASDINKIKMIKQAKMHSYLQFGYSVENTGAINPFNMSLLFEAGKSYQKTSVELNYKKSYTGKGKGLDIRIFTGTMLENASDPVYSFASGSRCGREQYLFEGIFPDRFGEFPKTFFSRQMSKSEGGLVTPVNDSIGYSRWVCSLSLTSTLPGLASRLPVKPFVNLLVNDHNKSNNKFSRLFVEAGFKTGIWNFFEVYIPVLVSDNIYTIGPTTKERIRFVFRLDKLNPLRSK